MWVFYIISLIPFLFLITHSLALLIIDGKETSSLSMCFLSNDNIIFILFWSSVHYRLEKWQRCRFILIKLILLEAVFLFSVFAMPTALYLNKWIINQNLGSVFFLFVLRIVLEKRLSTSHKKKNFWVLHHSELCTMVILHDGCLIVSQTFFSLWLPFLHSFCTHWLSDLNL